VHTPESFKINPQKPSAHVCAEVSILENPVKPSQNPVKGVK
jgi:hypothetical protein